MNEYNPSVVCRPNDGTTCDVCGTTVIPKTQYQQITSIDYCDERKHLICITDDKARHYFEMIYGSKDSAASRTVIDRVLATGNFNIREGRDLDFYHTVIHRFITFLDLAKGI